MALSITDLKKGTIFSYQSQPYKVVEYSQKVMGRGGSIVNVKIKNLIDGKVLDKTLKGNDTLESADLSQVSAQYLYKDNSSYYFMNKDSFDQFTIQAAKVGDSGNYINEGDDVNLILFNGQPIGIDVPKNVALKVTYAEDVVKGDTSTSITKDATLETGLVIKVPAFIKQGDIISVDTSNGSYRERIR